MYSWYCQYFHNIFNKNSRFSTAIKQAVNDSRAGGYKVVVRVVDILGNDTAKTLKIKVV